MKKTLFFLYKTTNIINGKFYIGVHQTTNINDGYLGSGLNLRRAIKKYGRDNFHKEILEFFDSPEEMFQKEREIVNEDFISLKNNYNLKIGGIGNSIGRNNTFYGRRHSENSKKRMSESKKGIPMSEATKHKIKKTRKSKKFRHSEKTKQILREKNTGNNNPRFGAKMTPKEKSEMIKRVTGLKRSKATKERIRQARIGTKLSKETKNKVSKTQTGKKHSEETKQKISLILTSRECTKETRQKISESHKGKIFSEEHRKNIGAKSKINNKDRKKIFNIHTGQIKFVKSNRIKYFLENGWQLGTNKTSHNKDKREERVECPHCNKIGGKNAMMRWHFNNCKFKS